MSVPVLCSNMTLSSPKLGPRCSYSVFSLSKVTAFALTHPLKCFVAHLLTGHILRNKGLYVPFHMLMSKAHLVRCHFFKFRRAKVQNATRQHFDGL